MRAPYHPVGCRLYGELEARIVHGEPCRLVYRDGTGRPTIERTCIADIYTRRGEEFIRLPRGREIRLDAIMRVDDQRFVLGPVDN